MANLRVELDPLDQFNKGCKDGYNWYAYDMGQDRWYKTGYLCGRAQRIRKKRLKQHKLPTGNQGFSIIQGEEPEYIEVKSIRFDPRIGDKVPY